MKLRCALHAEQLATRSDVKQVRKEVALVQKDVAQLTIGILVWRAVAPRNSIPLKGEDFFPGKHAR